MDPLFLLLHYLIKAGKEVSFPFGAFAGRGRRHHSELSTERAPVISVPVGQSTLPCPEAAPPEGDLVWHWVTVPSAAQLAALRPQW